jgi:PAS domain S-box-containing protein
MRQEIAFWFLRHRPRRLDHLSGREDGNGGGPARASLSHPGSAILRKSLWGTSMSDPSDSQSKGQAMPPNPYVERLFEITPDMLCVATMDGYFKIINPAFERNLGYSLGELKEKPFLDFIHPDDRPATLREMEKLSQGEVTLFFENRYLCKDGSYKWLAWTSHPDLKEGLLYAVAREVTQRKQEIISLRGERTELEEKRTELMGRVEETQSELQEAEEQLRQAQKMEAVGRLAGGIAHDFNNMLMAIMGFADIALNEINSPDVARRCLMEIKGAGKRSANLTRQLLAFGRKQVLEPRRINLNHIVVGMEEILRRGIRENIELVNRFDENLGVVFVDPVQVEQVMLNLALNASDAMPDGGELTIETRNVDLGFDFERKHPEVKPGPYALLMISDSGIGMDEATLSRIFEPFFTTKPVGVGTGLGLAMTYGVVKQSGGVIWASSEPGAGTRFEIFFPRVPGENSESDSAPAVSTPSEGGSETILLVEDEKVVLDLTASILEASGYQVVTASTPRQALEIMAHQTDPIHLMITDVVMPNMSGPTLAKRMLAEHPELKLIFMSGYTDDAVVENGFIQPGSVFLQKPFSPDTLKAKVRELLDSDD